MKEIKAYVRAAMGRTASWRRSPPRAAWTSRFVEARRVVPGLAPEAYSFSVELGDRFESIMKFELVCRDESAERLVEAIRHAARTGRHGDGVIFIADVADALHISDGVRGPQALTF